MKFSAWSKDRDALKSASSGGIFFELAKEIVKQGGQVAGVIMHGTKPIWHLTDDLDEIKRMRGSKYIWCNPLNVFTKICRTANRRKTLFVGLPCQIASLKRLTKHYYGSYDNIIYVSLRCNGVIDTKIFYDYVDHIEKVTGKIVIDIKFRDKEYGWSKGVCIGFTFDDHKTRFFKPKIINDYIKKLNVSQKCKACTYDRNNSDITLGDHWGCHPALKNRYGTSIVETNTHKGYRLFIECNNITWKYVPENLDDILVNNDKIGLLKVEDFENFGNQMLSCNFITYMKAINKNAKFVFIENNSAKDVIEKATGLANDIEYRYTKILSMKQDLLDTFKGIVNPKQMEQVKAFADCKHVVVLGGDPFSGGIKYLTWIKNLVELNALAKCGKQVHIVSNTVGKFPWFLRPFVKHVFNNLETIWCRDTDSISRCHAVGIKGNLCYAPDLAFLPLHNELKNEVEGIKDRYCTIVTTASWSLYANTYDEYINGIKDMAYALHGYTGKRIMILPHGTYPSDIQIARDVEVRCIPRLEKNKFIFALVGKEPMTTNKARSILANSYLNISFRMHGAISSLQSGVPVIAIAYSPKYKGVISDGYGLPELVISKMSRRKWSKCVNDTIENIKYVLEHKNGISYDIARVNTDMFKKVLKPLFNIFFGEK